MSLASCHTPVSANTSHFKSVVINFRLYILFSSHFCCYLGDEEACVLVGHGGVEPLPHVDRYVYQLAPESGPGVKLTPSCVCMCAEGEVLLLQMITYRLVSDMEFLLSVVYNSPGWI